MRRNGKNSNPSPDDVQGEKHELHGQSTSRKELSADEPTHELEDTMSPVEIDGAS